MINFLMFRYDSLYFQKLSIYLDWVSILLSKEITQFYFVYALSKLSWFWWPCAFSRTFTLIYIELIKQSTSSIRLLFLHFRRLTQYIIPIRIQLLFITLILNQNLLINKVFQFLLGYIDMILSLPNSPFFSFI